MTAARIEDARPGDDAALRALLRSATVPGEVALGFQREPSFFAADAILGAPCETLVARAGEAIVGVASAATRSLYVGGEACDVAYLSQLRIAPGHQGRGLVMRGWRALRERLCARGVAGAVATVSVGNRVAEGVLLARPGREGRHGTGFVPLTTLHTLTFAATRGRHAGDVPVTPATTHDVGEVVAFLARTGPRRQLFPAVTAATFGGARPGLGPGDVLLARVGGALRGVLAVWDQSRVRQTVVRGYGPRLARLKPLLDLGRLARGARPLPRVDGPLRVACASFLCIADDDPHVAAALLTAGVRAAHAKGAHALALGLTDEDPLLTLARRRRHVAYRSRLLALPLAEQGFVDRLTGVRFVDVGTL
jgi:hypothetical protein